MITHTQKFSKTDAFSHKLTANRFLLLGLHFFIRMNKGDLFVVSSEEYQQWYFGQMWAKNSIIVDEEEDW